MAEDEISKKLEETADMAHSLEDPLQLILL